MVTYHLVTLIKMVMTGGWFMFFFYPHMIYVMNMAILRIFLGYNLTSNMCMLWESNMSTVADSSWKTHYNWRIYGLFIKTNKECSISTSFEYQRIKL